MLAVEPPNGDIEAVDWKLMSLIVLSSMMGVGVLVSPTDFQKLGWLPSLTFLLLFALISAYSGRLLAWLFAQFPWVGTLHELAHSFKALGAAMVAPVYISAFAAPIAFHLVCQGALMQVLGSEDDSSVKAGFLVVLLLSPTALAEKLGEIGWLSVVGSGSMASAMAALCIKLIMAKPSQEPETHIIAPSTPTEKLIGILDLLFVFGGQANWGRFIEGMAGQRRMFAYSALLASFLLLLVASAVATIGYGTLGGHLKPNQPISDSLAPDGWTRAINVGVFAGIYVMDAVQINVCTQLLLEACLPRLFKPVAHGHTLGGTSTCPPYKLTRKVAASRHRKEVAEEDDCGVAGPAKRDASSRDKGEHLAEVRDAGITHKNYKGLSELSEPLLPAHPRPLEEDLEPTHALRISKSQGAPAPWIVDMQDQMLADKHLQQRSGASTHAGPQQQQQQKDQQQSEGQQEQGAAHGSDTAAPQDSTQLSAGVPQEQTSHEVAEQAMDGGHASQDHSFVAYSEDERGFPRACPSDLRQASTTSTDSYTKKQRALMKRAIWACTSLSFMFLYWGLSSVFTCLPVVMALMGATGAVTAMLLLPCSLALKLLRLSKAERAVCFAGCLLSITLTIAGCAATFTQMKDDLRH